MKQTIFVTILLCITVNTNAMDVTEAICTQDIFSKSELTKRCNQNVLISSLLCRGNEAKVYCDSAIFDANERKLSISFGFTHKHVPFFLDDEEPFELYNYGTGAVLHLTFDSSCDITEKQFDTTLFGFAARIDFESYGLNPDWYDLDDAMRLRLRQICAIVFESAI